MLAYQIFLGHTDWHYSRRRWISTSVKTYGVVANILFIPQLQRWIYPENVYADRFNKELITPQRFMYSTASILVAALCSRVLYNSRLDSSLRLLSTYCREYQLILLTRPIWQITLQKMRKIREENVKIGMKRTYPWQIYSDQSAWDINVVQLVHR